ncbi:hypothetical protein SAMN05421688_2737 [Poseidonocella pacifica]|uniref:Uncharacterized protein n=1 Tax=Poseidonocella pacifica TaxID=871651 RepID=A0A1I0Y4U1_9RHOB|nr:hypothetical protein [Poseidonocella pacifica]SFB07183.1 hypothetical protein SAMN05421688_2737 [Poseidonocella pacifica]
MFGLIRLVIFVLLAFTVGMFYERQQAAERCGDLGGRMAAGLCVGVGS